MAAAQAESSLQTSHKGSLSAASVDTGPNTYATPGKALRAFDRLVNTTGLTRSPATTAATAQLDETRDVFNKVSQTGILTKDQEMGTAKVEPAANELRDFYVRQANVAAMGYNKEFLEANVHMGDSGKLFYDRATLGKTKITQEVFDDEVFKMVQIPGYETKLPEIEPFLKRAVRHQEKFYKFMYEEGVGRGALPQRSNHVGNYLPIMWNRARIDENPAAFKEFLSANFRMELDDAWLDSQGLTKAQFDELDDAAKEPLYREFEEENDLWSLEQAEAAAEAAQKRYRKSWNALKEISKVARGLTSKAQTARTKVAAAHIKGLEQRKNFLTSEAEAARAETETFQHATAAAHQAKQARLNADRPFARAHDPSYETWRMYQKKAKEMEEFWEDPKRWKAANNAIRHGKGKTHSKNDFNHTELNKRVKSFQKWEAKWNEASGRTYTAPKDPIEKIYLNDPRYNYLKGRAAEADFNFQRLQRKAKAMENKYDNVLARQLEINTTYRQLQDKLKVVKELQADYKKRWKTAGREAKKAKKGADEVRTKGKSIRQTVNDTYNAMVSRDRVPSGVIYDGALMGETARGKYRALKIETEEQFNALKESGFINTNIGQLTEAYTRDLGGRMALIDKFGTDEPEKIVNQLGDVYKQKQEAAQLAGDNAKAESIHAEWQRVSPQLAMMVDKVLGKWDVKQAAQSGDIISYLSRMGRYASTTTMMGLSAVSNIADLAVMALHGSPAKKAVRALSTNVARIVKQADNREMGCLLMAAENNPQMARVNQTMGIDNVSIQQGVGRGWVRSATARAERGSQYLAERMFDLNLTRQWTSRMSYIAGVDVLTKTTEIAKKVYKGRVAAGDDWIKASQSVLTDAEKRHIAYMGLEEGDLARYAELWDQHGGDVQLGAEVPATHLWGDKGADLKRKLNVGLDRAIREVVLRVEEGDLPPVVSTTVGKVIFQFQSWGFATQKWARNLDRKARNGEGAKALSSIMWALGLGATAYVIRQGVIRGEWEEVEDTIKSPGILREAVDRGGLLFMMNPYINAGLKLAATQTDRFIDDPEENPIRKYNLLPSRYKERTPFSAMLGPSYGMLENIQMAMTESDTEKLGKRLFNMLPYKNLWAVEFLLGSGKNLLTGYPDTQ